MPTFKPKNTKQILVNQKITTTLDEKHKEIVDGFRNTTNVLIPSLRKEKNECQEKLNKEDITIEERLDIQDRIKEIEQEIKTSKKNEKNYFFS